MLRTFGFALLVFALLSTYSGESAPIAGISGRVVDAITGRVIPSAVVRISYAPRKYDPARQRRPPSDGW